MVAKVWSLVFVPLRVVLCVGLLTSGHPLGVVLGLSELVCLAGTVYSVSVGRVDQTWSGMLVPVAFCTSVLFYPGGVSLLPWLPAAFVVLALVKTGVRLNLGLRCTVGVPVFVKLEDRGAYRLVRHPLSVLEALTGILFALANFTPWNVAIAVLRLGVCGWIVTVEERHLRQEPEYVAYADRVRWRWCPGVW